MEKPKRVGSNDPKPYKNWQDVEVDPVHQQNYRTSPEEQETKRAGSKTSDPKMPVPGELSPVAGQTERRVPATSGATQPPGKSSDPDAVEQARNKWREEHKPEPVRELSLLPTNEGEAIKCAAKQSGNGDSDPSKRTKAVWGQPTEDS